MLRLIKRAQDFFLLREAFDAVPVLLDRKDDEQQDDTGCEQPDGHQAGGEACIGFLDTNFARHPKTEFLVPCPDAQHVAAQIVAVT